MNYQPMRARKHYTFIPVILRLLHHYANLVLSEVLHEHRGQFDIEDEDPAVMISAVWDGSICKDYLKNVKDLLLDS